jgi:hypothetical protein
VHLPCSLLGKSGLLFTSGVATELVVCGQRQELLQHSWLPFSTNAFREKRWFVRPSIRLRFASELQYIYISPVSQPRTASVYCCHLLNAAFCLRSHRATQPHAHGPRPAARPPPWRCAGPKLNGAHPGSLTASRVRGALVMRAQWWLFGRLATSAVSHLAPFSRSTCHLPRQRYSLRSLLSHIPRSLLG